jgi:2-polyprenyl-3-methyl-5-hydroxy-6-metoxy-1,4-benzoquinol methylase
MKNNIDITQITSNLNEEKGIFHSKIINSISYPKKGNDNCYQIEDESYWFQQRNAILSTVIKRHSNGKTIFDIGGGNGVVSACLQNEGYETYLVEPGTDGIANARKRGVKYLINATFDDVGFKNNCIHNAGLFDVIEHIEDDSGFLKKLYPLIKSNGKVFVTVPAFMFLWSNADISAGHYRRYTIKSIAQLMNEVGFSVVYSTYFFSYLAPLIFLFRTIPSLFFQNKPSKRVIKNEHKPSSSVSKSFMKIMHRLEYSRIVRNKKIYFGSSCLIVAIKK